MMPRAVSSCPPADGQPGRLMTPVAGNIGLLAHRRGQTHVRDYPRRRELKRKKFIKNTKTLSKKSKKKDKQKKEKEILNKAKKQGKKQDKKTKDEETDWKTKALGGMFD